MSRIDDLNLLRYTQNLKAFANSLNEETKGYVDEKVADLENSTKAYIDEKNDSVVEALNEAIGKKQDKLTAGDNISISEDNVISATPKYQHNILLTDTTVNKSISISFTIITPDATIYGNFDTLRTAMENYVGNRNRIPANGFYYNGDYIISNISSRESDLQIRGWNKTANTDYTGNLTTTTNPTLQVADYISTYTL